MFGLSSFLPCMKFFDDFLRNSCINLVLDKHNEILSDNEIKIYKETILCLAPIVFMNDPEQHGNRNFYNNKR